MGDKRDCPDKPCQSTKPSQSQTPQYKSSEDVYACLKRRPILYAGVLWIGVMRRFLIPRSCRAQEAAREVRPVNYERVANHFNVTEQPLAAMHFLEPHQKRASEHPRGFSNESRQHISSPTPVSQYSQDGEKMSYLWKYEDSGANQ